MKRFEAPGRDEPNAFLEQHPWLEALWSRAKRYVRRNPVEGAAFAFLLGAVAALLARRHR
jgi:hypothetical protein